MADYDYDLCFRGIDQEECFGFIRQVRRKAFEARKSRDREWMADYAVSCFADDALSWSLGVGRDVLEDWDVLQRALMEKYSKSRTHSSDVLGSAETIPAAAPVASPLGATLPASISAATGHIRIIAESPGAGNYVSKTVDDRYGVLLACTGLEEAARVKLVPFMSNYGIQLLGFPEPYSWLGICLGGGLEEGGRIGSESFGNLCPTSAPASHAMGTSATGLPGPARSTVWLIQSLDSSIISVWENSDFIYVLQPMINLGNKRILAASNCPEFRASNSGKTYAKARLLFEPS